MRRVAKGEGVVEKEIEMTAEIDIEINSEKIKERKRRRKRLGILASVLAGGIAGYLGVLGYSIFTIQFWIIFGALMIFGVAKQEYGWDGASILHEETMGNTVNVMTKLNQNMAEVVGKMQSAAADKARPPGDPSMN